LLANVYVSCDGRSKHVLWNLLSNFILHRNNSNWWCVWCYWNSICSEEERRSSGHVFRLGDYNCFNSFIDDFLLFDLLSFSMSIIDRFLISKEWSQLWPNCFWVTFLWGMYDHCFIMLFDMILIEGQIIFVWWNVGRNSQVIKILLWISASCLRLMVGVGLFWMRG